MLLAVSHFILLYYFYFFDLFMPPLPEIGSRSVVQAVLELLSPGWLEPGAISHFHLPGPGITGVSRRAQLFISLAFFFFKLYVLLLSYYNYASLIINANYGILSLSIIFLLITRKKGNLPAWASHPDLFLNNWFLCK